jgi:pre-mRNA-splicing factor ATP-dependent RNA helicase DHX15/PRP43
MSDKYSSKKDKDLLGKKKKLNLDTFLQEVESNPKKKKLNPKKSSDSSDSESEETFKKNQKPKKSPKKEKKSKKKLSQSDSSDTEIFKINPEQIKSSIAKKPKQINKFTGKEYTESYYKLLEKRKLLPVWSSKAQILDLVEKNRIVIIQGETGSGKTTQIPQFLLEAGYYGGIVCTQPRRVAAMSIAKRVSQEMEVELGAQVGYTVRFDDKTSNDTLIKYATDGLLLKEATTDHTLKKYQIIIIDEAHERTLATDILFGFLKELMEIRKELKLIIMSATFDIEKFQNYFDAPLAIIKGRTYPVEINYLSSPTDDYVDCAIKKVIQIHKEEKPGDILLFLTGEEEIESACQQIREGIEELGDEVGYANVVPIYSTLPPYLQEKIFEPPPGPNPRGIKGRKIVVATNIAESSITIDGIVYVVDPGFTKQKVFNPRGKMESLLINIISKENADQRAGRAGRTKPGKCFRLYTKESYEKELKKSSIPEILRSNITSVVLNLLKLGIQDLVHFDFIDPPAPETMMRAIEMLNYLGAMDDDGKLTELGSQMNQFPLEPELSKMVLAGVKYKCINDMLTIAATLSVKSPFLRPRGKENEADSKKYQFTHHSGDHITLIMVYNAFKKNENQNWCRDNYINFRTMKAIDNVRGQLADILKKMNITVTDNDYNNEIKGKRERRILKSLIAGYFAQVAHLETAGYYITVKDNQYVFIHPSSYLHGSRKATWVLFHEFVLTSKNYIRTVTEIKPEYLLQVAPHYFDLDKMTGYAYKRDLMKVKNELEKENELKEEEKNL